MSRIHLKDRPRIAPIPSKMYQLYFPVTGMTDKEVDNLLKLFEYHRKNKFPDASFFIATSVMGEVTGRFPVKSGKRGRPKHEVAGTKKDRHVHIGIIGNNTTPYAFAEYMRKKLILYARKMQGHYKGYKPQIWATKDDIHTINFIIYSFMQSYRFNTGGDYNFKQYQRLNIKEYIYEGREHQVNLDAQYIGENFSEIK